MDEFLQQAFLIVLLFKETAFSTLYNGGRRRRVAGKDWEEYRGRIPNLIFSAAAHKIFSLCTTNHLQRHNYNRKSVDLRTRRPLFWRQYGLLYVVMDLDIGRPGFKSYLRQFNCVTLGKSLNLSRAQFLQLNV